MLAYYPDRSSPLLVKIGWRGVTGAALVPGWTSELAARLSIVRKSSGEFDISSEAAFGHYGRVYTAPRTFIGATAVFRRL